MELINKQNLGRNIIKFLIGLFAGIVSAIFPRLIPVIVSPSLVNEIEMFNSSYLVVCLIFALIVALVILVMYSEVKVTNRQLFLAALGIPALLSGGFSMNDSLDQGMALNREIVRINNEKDELLKSLSRKSNINIIDTTELFIGVKPSSQFEKKNEVFSFPFISSAYAQQQEPKKESKSTFSPGVKFKTMDIEELYVTVIRVSSDSLNLVTEQRELSNKGLEGLKLLKSGSMFYLIINEKMNKTEGLLKSIEIKNEYQLEPNLMRIQSQ